MPQIPMSEENIRLNKPFFRGHQCLSSTLVDKLLNGIFQLGKEMPGLFESIHSQTCCAVSSVSPRFRGQFLSFCHSEGLVILLIVDSAPTEG